MCTLPHALGTKPRQGAEVQKFVEKFVLDKGVAVALLVTFFFNWTRTHSALTHLVPKN